MGQSGNVINRLAECDDWQAARQRQAADGAVDRHHSPAAREHLAEIPPVDDDQPVSDPQFRSEMTGYCSPIDEPAVERMKLDDQPTGVRRMMGERTQARARSPNASPEKGNAPASGSRSRAAKGKRITGPRPPPAFDRCRCRSLGSTFQRQAAKPTSVFDQLVVWSMSGIMWESAIHPSLTRRYRLHPRLLAAENCSAPPEDRTKAAASALARGTTPDRAAERSIR